jgi:hypothetical protein
MLMCKGVYKDAKKYQVLEVTEKIATTSTVGRAHATSRLKDGNKQISVEEYKEDGDHPYGGTFPYRPPVPALKKLQFFGIVTNK